MLFRELTAVALAFFAQEPARVPGDADARLDEAMRAELAGVDAAREGWTNEERGASAGARLALLGEILRDLTVDSPTGGAGAERLGELAADDFTATPPVPGAPGRVFAGEGFVARAAFGGEAERGYERSGDERPAGALALARALAELARPWPAPRSFAFKVVGVADAPGGFTTEVRVTGSGGAVQRNAVWSCRWREIEGGEPRLARIDVRSLDEVEVTRPFFVDRTAAVLGEAAREWTRGLNHWRRTLDARLGVSLLGHPSGIAIGDVDGDGLEDVYLCQPGGLPNRLLLHQRDHTLRDASAGSGADFLDFSRGVLLIDLDGDADRDLVVSVVDELLFLENDGAGRFRRRAAVSAPQATSLAAADHDLDGDLDLYVCAYFSPYDGDAVPVPYHDAENGQPNLMLENRGDWRFVDVTAAVGLDAKATRFSFAASWEDFDLDGDPDLYVANDFGRNSLYRNDGGRYVDVAAQAGVEDIAAGMGVAWGDVDADGDFDLYVSNMYSAAGNRVVYQRRFHAGADDDVLAAYRRHARGNTLFENAGDGTFVDVSEAAGVTMGRWAWGSRFVDVNLDGWLDVLVPNGFLTAELAHDL